LFISKSFPHIINPGTRSPQLFLTRLNLCLETYRIRINMKSAECFYLFNWYFPSLHQLDPPFEKSRFVCKRQGCYDIMKVLRTSVLLTILLPVSVFAQNVPWTFQSGQRSFSGQGNERCHPDLLRQNDQYSFQTWPAQSAPSNPSPPSSQSCSLHTTLRKEWERRDEVCTKEKDRKRKEQCYDKLENDKKSERTKVDDCLKKRERACGAITDSKGKENCFSQLDKERKGGAPVQSSSSSSQQRQTKCCLKLFSDNSCKNKVFEACSSGTASAKGDAPSWTVNCA
jgi:hypothetical protein